MMRMPMWTWAEAQAMVNAQRAYPLQQVQQLLRPFVGQAPAPAPRVGVSVAEFAGQAIESLLSRFPPPVPQRSGPMGEWYFPNGTCLMGRAIAPLAVFAPEDGVYGRGPMRLHQVLAPDIQFLIYEDQGDEYLFIADRFGQPLGRIKKAFFGVHYTQELVRCPPSPRNR